jgi:pimeloyl-ACP methyl ester carboxylesterase
MGPGRNGNKDLDCPMENPTFWLTSSPSTLIVMEGGGHGMMYQFPERMAMDIASFLGKGR